MAYADGVDTLEEYKENKQKISSEREELISKLKKLKDSLQDINQIDEIDEDVYKKICNVYELLINENVDMETKYQTAHFLIEKITISRKTNTLKLTYK